MLANRMRSLLTMLGILIGTAAVILLVAVGTGTTYALGTFVGATPLYAQIRNATVTAGRNFDDSDESNHAKVAVIGQTVVDHLWSKGFNPVGQQVAFNGVRFRIIGLLEKKGSSGVGDQDDVMIAPMSTVKDSLVGNIDTYTLIAVQAASRTQTDAAQAEAMRNLREAHKLKPNQPLDFQIFNQASLLNTGKAAALVFSLLLAAVAAISLFVGGIGVMNIMLVTVTERTREIGIRKALGAQRRDILSQFLVEAVLLAGLGGLMGVGIGIGAGQYHGNGLNPVISPMSVVLSFSVSILIGVFFGLYPASRAAALTPIEALRFE